MICMNPECPDMVEGGTPGEYREGITVCPKCGALLVELRADGSGEPVSDLVTIELYRENHLAHLAESRLIAKGLHPQLVDEYSVAMNWLAAGAFGLTKLMVPESEAEQAREALASHEDELSADDAGESGIAPDETDPGLGADSTDDDDHGPG